MRLTPYGKIRAMTAAMTAAALAGLVLFITGRFAGILITCAALLTYSVFMIRHLKDDEQ